MKLAQVAFAITLVAILGFAASFGSGAPDRYFTMETIAPLFADNPRKERRDDRQEDRPERRDDRRDCRQDEGRLGNDKRDCKQEGRGEDDYVDADTDNA